MSYDALFSEIRSLPNSMVAQVAEFVRFLRFSMDQGSNGDVPGMDRTADASGDRILEKRKGGILSDCFIAIADDFDDTPDCLKEYM